MRHRAGMRAMARIAILILLAAGSAFALNVTVTNSPYSAVPDDGLDDSAAFASALNDIVADGGGTLAVPCGNYDFTNKVTVDLHAAAVTIAGDGAAVSVLNCTSNNTDGVFLFNNTDSCNQLTLKDFTIEAEQLGGTAIAVFNPSLSTAAICSLSMQNVTIMPAVDQVNYFTCHVDAANLKSPVFYNVVAAAAIRIGYTMTAYRIATVDSPVFEQTYVKHADVGYRLTGIQGAANFYRAYCSDTRFGYDLAATPAQTATLRMRHFHSGAYDQGINVSDFDQVEILEHMSYAGDVTSTIFLDQVFTDCANVNIKGTIFHAMVRIPRTMISLKGTTHDVFIEDNIFNGRGTAVGQDSTVRGVLMVGCHDNSQE